MTETNDELTLTAELPGTVEKDVALSFENDVLRLSGETQEAHEETAEKFRAELAKQASRGTGGRAGDEWGADRARPPLRPLRPILRACALHVTLAPTIRMSKR